MDDLAWVFRDAPFLGGKDLFYPFQPAKIFQPLIDEGPGTRFFRIHLALAFTGPSAGAVYQPLCTDGYRADACRVQSQKECLEFQTP